MGVDYVEKVKRKVSLTSNNPSSAFGRNESTMKKYIIFLLVIFSVTFPVYSLESKICGPGQNCETFIEQEDTDDFSLLDKLQDNYQNGLFEIIHQFSNFNGTLEKINKQMAVLIGENLSFRQELQKLEHEKSQLEANNAKLIKNMENTMIESKISVSGKWTAEFDTSKVQLGGVKGSGKYIARWKLQDEVIPLKFLSSEWAYAVQGSKEVTVDKRYSTVEFLETEPHYEWVAKSDGDISHGVVIGGKTRGNKNIYVCRVEVASGIKAPGGLVPSRRQCIVAYHGVVKSWDYEVLRDSRYA